MRIFNNLFFFLFMFMFLLGHLNPLETNLQSQDHNPSTEEDKILKRTSPQLQTILLDSEERRIGMDSTTTYTVTLEKSPIIARIQAEVFHQGTDVKPIIRVNNIYSGTLEPVFPSLSDYKYIFFMFDDNQQKETDYQVDYNGWLPATGFIQGRLLHPGDNAVSFSVGTDRINIRNLKMEILFDLDLTLDRRYDLREETWKKIMEEYQRTGRIRQ